MSISRQQYAKVAPTMPTGEPIASYPTYAEAQKAIAHLVEQHFPVEALTIVGTDLRSVERVTGRLSYGRVALAGAMSGAWFGLFVGLLMSMFGGAGVATGVGFISVLIGAGFGLLFSVLSYGLTRSRRDFTSSTQIVASQYAVLCMPEAAYEARRLLGGHSFAPAAAVAPLVRPVVPPTAPVSELSTYHAPEGERPVGVPVAPPKIDSRWTTEDGKPKFGALAADHPGVELPKAPPEKPAEVVIPVLPPVVTPDQGGKKDPYDKDPFAPPKR